MARELIAEKWADAVWESEPRDLTRLVGFSVTLAAKLLGVSRMRVHQLIDEGKLSVLDIYENKSRRYRIAGVSREQTRNVRIGHLVTLASIARRRRTRKPRKTQWRSERSGVSQEGLNPRTGLPDSVPWRGRRTY